MTIKHLRIFIAVAESGNMSATAAKFYISQPTVSQIIAELERHYEVQLFDRFPRRLCLTAAGQTLLIQAQRVVACFDELEYSMLHDFKTQPLRIGATVTVGTCVLPQIATAFQDENKELRAEVSIDNTAKIEEKLLDSKLDIALIEGKVKSLELEVIPAIQDYLVLVCGAGHPFAVRDEVSLQELPGENFISREEGSGTRELFETYMKMKGYTIKSTWVSNNSEAIKNAVINNQGLSVLSIRLVKNEIASGKIHVVKIRDCIWNRKFSLVYRKNRRLSKPMERFAAVVQAYQGDQVLELVPGVNKAGGLPAV